MYFGASILLSSCFIFPVISASKPAFQQNIRGVPTKVILKEDMRYLLQKQTRPGLLQHLAALFKPRSKYAYNREPSNNYRNPKAYTIFGKTYRILEKSQGYKARGVASWYGAKFHRRKTSSGDRYNMYAMTAAHKTLPLPTYVRVRNLSNGREVIVKVNDRGPFYKDRIIDLSYAAGAKLGLLVKGVAMVEVEALPRNFAG
ncbi:MAG: septal ring lytic transglycosylase RlpA family protein [Legionella sp.]|nr:septal ring lytic transglycosylase RlpA family protein [Legionella sp.]